MSRLKFLTVQGRKNVSAKGLIVVFPSCQYRRRLRRFFWTFLIAKKDFYQCAVRGEKPLGLELENVASLCTN